MYRAGIASILSQLVREDRLSVIEGLALDAPKTKQFAQKIKGFGMPGTLLVVIDKLDENLYLASRNLPNVLVLETREVDPVSLVRFQNVLLTQGGRLPVRGDARMNAQLPSRQDGEPASSDAGHAEASPTTPSA